MKKIFFLILVLISFKLSAQTYDATKFTLSNKSYGPAQAVPTDARSYFYDLPNFIMRPYQDTIEVLSYLNLPKYRAGNFLIYVHSGGVLNGNGTFTGGTVAAWWFKDGTADVDLVPFTIGGGGGILQGLQDVISYNHVLPIDNLITMPDVGIDWVSGDTTLAGAYSNLHIFPDGTSNLTRSDAAHYGRIVTTPVSASISNQNSIDRVTFSIDGTNDAILPKVLLTGVPTGAGYVLTDVAGNGNLTLEPSAGVGGNPSWNTTMNVSPDLLQDYSSNFHNHNWAIDSINSLQFDAYSLGGESFRSQYFQPGYEVRYNLYNQNTSNLISSFLIDKSSLVGALFDSTNGNEINSITLSAVDSSIYLKTASNKIKADLDSAGPPTNSLWQDADGFIHRGAISGEGGSGCDTCFIPLSAVLPSLAALPIYARGNNTIVFVKEPKRGGVFTISDTGTADGGKIVPAVGGGFWVRDISQSQAVNLTWFGDSLGRGASSLTRDTTALHAAFAYLQSVGGGTLYVPNPPAFYAFAGHPIWFGDNIKLVGDGPEKSEIRNILPSTGGSFKGPIFQFSTYSSSTTSNPLQDSVPKYDLYTANINDTVLILRNIGDAAGLSAGEVIMYGCIETLKGSKPEFTYWELNEVTRISNDSVFLKLPIRINLIDDALGAFPQILNINNAGISSLYGFKNGTVKNIEISNIKLTQAQEGGNKDTTLTNSLAGIWQPGGAFNFYFHDLVIDAYSGIGGNMFTYGTFERIHFKGEKKFFDGGYASSRLRFIDNHDEYKESPASNFATARLIFNSGMHGLYIQNHLSDGDNFRGTQFATFAGVQDVQIDGFKFNYPNYYNDNNAINIAGDSDRPSKDIYINNIVVNAQAVGQGLRISQDPNTTLANSNINITNAQFHTGFIGNEGNALFTFTFTATNPPVRNDEYTNNGSTFAFRGGKSTDIGNGLFQAPFIRIAGTNDPLSSGTLTRTLGAGDATLNYSSVVVAEVSEAYALNTSNVRGLHISNFQSEQGKFYINRDSNSTFLAMQTTDSLLAKFNYNTDIGATVPTASDTCLGNALSIIGGIGYINCARLGGGGGGVTQGLQDVITQDPSLTTNNTISVGSNLLNFTTPGLPGGALAILDVAGRTVVGMGDMGLSANQSRVVVTDQDSLIEIRAHHVIMPLDSVSVAYNIVTKDSNDSLHIAALPTDTLQTNGVNNSSQTKLNLVAGSNIGLTESNGSVTIDAIVDSTGCEVFAGDLLYNVDTHTLAGDSNKIETKAYARYQIDSLANKKVDSIYRTPGKDSIQFLIQGRYYAIKDSIGLTGNQNITLSGDITGSGTTAITTTYNGVVPINKGGTNITSYTTGDILYASATNVLSKLPIGTATQVLHISGGVPAWRDTASITCCYWPLQGTGTGTAATNITYNTPNWLAFKGTYTTTANNQWWRQESPTITARGTASDAFIATQLAPTLIFGANTQEGIALDIAPTFTPGAFTLPEQTAIRSKGNINPVGSGTWNLGRTANMWAGVYANRWYGTVWDANGPNNLQVNINGYKPMTIISATQNIKFGSITTTTLDSLYKVDINGDAKVMGGLVVAALPTPVITSVTNQGAAGATNYSYVLVYKDITGRVSGASAVVSTTTGNATLSPSNFNRINFSGAENAGLTAYYHDLYRTVGGTSQGKVATSAGYALTSVDDIGGAGDGTTAPAENTSGAVGVNALRPNSNLQVVGSTSFNYTAVTSTYSILQTDYTVDCTSGTFTITLPTAVGIKGRFYILKNTGTGVITIATTSSQTIEGATTLGPGDHLTVQSNNANWIVTEGTRINKGIQTYAGTDTWDGTAPTTSVSKQYQWVQTGKKVEVWVWITYSVAGATNTNLDLSWPADLPLPQEPAGRTATNDVIQIGIGRIAISTSSATANVKAAFIIKTGTLTYKMNVSSAAVSAKTADFYCSYTTQRFNWFETIMLIGFFFGWVRLLKKRLWLFVLPLFGCTKPEQIHTGQSSNSVTQRKPNIIFILLDDIGYEIPTYTGGQSYSTPNIDNLANNGMQFMYAHACPMCSPSRVQLYTGKYSYRNYKYWGVLPESEPTFVQKLKAGGYSTCAAGKWQLDGGDEGIHHAGFDKYRVWNPYAHQEGNKYKNPKVYQNGAYLSDSFTNGKYGDDLFKDYMFNFIDSNVDKPFFVYWAMNLCHVPHHPTPDDPEFKDYNPDSSSNVGEIKYYPSMVKYTDKLVGMLKQKLADMNLLHNTLIILAGDNGTSRLVTSLFNGKRVNGDKGGTTVYATHVPLVTYWNGTIIPGIDSSLIEFTDFMPTILDAAGISLTTFVDGVSFYPQMLGEENPSQRQWVFFHFQPNPQTELIRWIMDRKYKEYDSGTAHLDSLINYFANPVNERGITNLTHHAENVKENFKNIMNTLK